MVGIWLFVGLGWVGLSPICGIVAVRAQWSLWLVAVDVMVVSMSLCCAVFGRRNSHWSKGVLDGIYVGVIGSPMWRREVLLQKP